MGGLYRFVLEEQALIPQQPLHLSQSAKRIPRVACFWTRNDPLTAKYCHYRQILGNIEGCEGPPNSVFSWEDMTNSRFLAGFVISRSSVRIRLPALPVMSGAIDSFPS
jgi:hypothetical protein